MNPDPACDRLYCYRCGYYWRMRNRQLPKTCPRCGSSRWNDPVRSEIQCRFCGRVWNLGSLSEPCPDCGRTIFETPDPSVLHCNRCVIMRCEIASDLREHGRGDSVDSVLNSMATIAAMGRGEEGFVKNICKKHRDLLLDLVMNFPEEIRTSQVICTPEEIEELGDSLPV